MDRASIEGLLELGTAMVHEAIGRKGAMAHHIKPLAPAMRLVGPALPVAMVPGDNLAIHLAVARAGPGQVLVVDAGGSLDWGPFGDILAEACLARGVRGLVIDGAVRDATSLKAMGFAVFCCGLAIQGTVKADPGTVGAPVSCGGVIVAAGDIVIGDEDGVVVVPATLAPTALAQARAREAKEATMRAAIRNGKTTLELLGLGHLLEPKRTGGKP